MPKIITEGPRGMQGRFFRPRRANGRSGSETGSRMGSGTSRRVAIIGGGEIGGFIAERLSEEQFDVLVLDRDPRVLAGLSDRLDVASELGDATSAAGPLKSR